ncbi:inositol 2-dehydrogenase [Neoroseomonas oryzicola]|uniref:Inositol 2-dehydrogenase n=1 Tax=Neoroseomonas oryzicola TaxID=535904 RepID=A0A9X9WCY9_9PROT|nr:inositol 2-dehydrogenase [Neoroseomonas oryzicola]MBR0658199.1 inositol 2-dehydrogenase [Neoroseomonas oryzicola]NKE15984.1 inositol 2-dehydrogenase [Neoroseomonas oryzicola]
MLVFAQFGAGRIGAIHAANLAASGAARLKYVVDVHAPAAASLAAKHGATVTDTATALADPEVGAVIVASSTDTHADLVIGAARAGKAIFCEKPIDLSLGRVDEALAAVRAAAVPMLVGFNRRFDPSFAELHRRVGAGAIGAVEQVIVTSRDPGLPPVEYLKVSGGQFRDMTIHDFDMARWMLGEEPTEVFAYGAALVDPAVAAVGDIDSCMVLLRTASGRMAHINNSRRASYGYDQRVEVHGSKGRLIAGNRVPTTVEQADADAVTTEKPLHFFLERYADAYRIELAAFIAAVMQRTPMPVGAEDGRQALVLAEAALRSLRENRPVKVSEIG